MDVNFECKIATAPANTAEKRLRMLGHKKNGEEFKCQIVR